jgi:arylsulfatase A-like enzyme
MPPTRSWFLTALATGCLAVPVAARAADTPRRAPNILVILADDLGYADLGCHGCPDVPTPHIDSLAKNGIRCTSGYVSGVYCSPTRAGLLTGRYQQRFGHEFNPGGAKADSDFGLPLGETTLADRLKAAGYATGLVGKWHLGNAPQFHPTRRGFQEFFGFLGGAHPFLPELLQKTRSILRGTQPVQESEYLTDAIAREAVAFVDRHQKEPFFLYLAFNAVHTPMHATENYLRRFETLRDPQRRTYAAMLSAMDDAVGAVLAKLRAAGLEENTLIFFLSDNGGPTMKGTTINGSINRPLRGSKRQTLEGGIRVPFLVQWKGRLPAGRTYDPPVIQLDLLPTVLAAAGVPVAKDSQLDGVNLLPHLQGSESRPPHETLYWRFGQQMAIRRGDWKLVRYDETAPKLYNLTADVGEQQDLAGQQPGKVNELRAAWDKWDATLAKPLWGPGRKQ